MIKIKQRLGDKTIQGSFIHIPKTGGTSVTHILRDNFESVPLNELNGHSLSHVYLKFITDKIKGTKTFCFVRDPITWYESVYKMILSFSSMHSDTNFKKTRRRGMNPIGNATFMYAPSFDKFIDNMLSQAPDYYYEVCSNYMGGDLDKIDYVGHTENLYNNLYNFLVNIGFEVDKNKILNAKSHGGRGHLNHHINWRGAQKERILDANSELSKSIHFKTYFK